MRFIKIYRFKITLLRVIAIIFIILFCFTNCISTQNYFINRGNDLKDIVNIGVEKDVYGVNAQIAVGVIGFQNASSGVGLGLRYGHFGIYKTGDDKNAISFYDDKEKMEIYFGNSNVFSSTNYHEPQTSKNIRVSQKTIKRLEFLFRRCANDIYEMAYRELPQAISEKQNWESKFDAVDNKLDARLEK